MLPTSQLLASIIDRLQEAVTLHDGHGHIHYANRRLLELFGIPDLDAAQRLQFPDDLSFDPNAGAQCTEQIEVARRDGEASFQWFGRKLNGNLMILDVALHLALDPLSGEELYLTQCTDSTDKTWSEVDLRGREAYFRFMTEESVDVVWRLDRNLNFVYINPADQVLRGFTREEVIGKNLVDFLKPETAERLNALRERVRAQERATGERLGPWQFEFEMACKSGAYRWMDININALRDDGDGDIIGFHGIARDISDRKAAEGALYEQQRRYAGLVDNSVDPIFAVSISPEGDMRYVESNHANTAFTGHSLDDLRGRSPVDLLPIDHKETILAYYAECLAQRSAVTYEAPLDFGKGVRNWSTQLVPIANREGRIDLIYGVARDITELRAVSQALEESERKFRSYFERSMVGMAAESTDHRFLEVNTALCQMLGYSPSELLTMTWDDVTHADDLELSNDQFNRVLRGEVDSYTYEKRLLRKDGGVVDAFLTAQCVRNSAGAITYLVVLMEDITERKRAQTELEQERNRLLDALARLQVMEGALRKLANTDGLTNLNNRRAFQEQAEEEIERSRRYKRPLALIMFDIDHFKHINDRFGHPVGDEALRRLARVVTATVRKQDLVGRVGGEEFAVLIPETSLRGGQILAERLRIAAASIIVGDGLGEQIGLTASFGVTALSATVDSYTQMYHHADLTLYRAKANGRNCVEVDQDANSV